MPKKIIISLVVGGLVSVLTLYLAFRNVPLNELLSYLGAINYWWILPAIGLIVTAFALRTIRWVIILKGICKVSFWEAFHPTMIGFMMNCVLPGRVGELARPVLLKKNRSIPITTGLATIAAERLFDLFILITLFALLFSTIAERPDLESNYFGLQLDSQSIKTVGVGMIRISVVLLLGIGIMIFDRTRNGIKRLITATGGVFVRLVPRLKKRIDTVIRFSLNIIDNIAIGLSLVRNPVRLFTCLAATVLIWSLTAVSYLVFAWGCPGISLTLMEHTTVMAIISFVIALPSVPGFWGVWEAGGVFALALFGIVEKDALGFTLVNHAVQIFPVIAIGLISALITSVNILQLNMNEATTNN